MNRPFYSFEEIVSKFEAAENRFYTALSYQTDCRILLEDIFEDYALCLKDLKRTHYETERIHQQQLALIKKFEALYEKQAPEE
mgnify:CR=1 FL=1